MNDAKRLLSPRQAECLRRVRALQSTDEIARDLKISPGTVNGYIRDAIAALGARDRRHAALIYEEAELGFDHALPPVPTEIKAMSATEFGLTAEVGDQPRGVVRDVSSEALPPVFETNLKRVFREIVDGSRPEGWSMLTRSALVLGAVVVIGMAMLFLSASLDIVYSLAVGIRAAVRH
jgi:DNA-binding CsgD family transcriptional regulator